MPIYMVLNHPGGGGGTAPQPVGTLSMKVPAGTDSIGVTTRDVYNAELDGTFIVGGTPYTPDGDGVVTIGSETYTVADDGKLYIPRRYTPDGDGLIAAEPEDVPALERHGCVPQHVGTAQVGAGSIYTPDGDGKFTVDAADVVPLTNHGLHVTT